MNVNVFVILVIVASLIFGVLIGIIIFRIHLLRENRKFLKGLQEVIEGKRKNSIFIDGKEYEALRFKLKDKEGKNIIVDLKGGGMIENAEEKSSKEDSREKDIPYSPPLGEDSPSPRKGKRTLRTRFRKSRRG